MINANWHYITNDRFQCHDKIAQMEKNIRDPAARANARLMLTKSNGCDTMSVEPKYVIDHLQYHTCFCNFLHPQFAYYLALFEAFHKGMLPFPGSTSEQPAQVVEIFMLLESLKAEYQADLQRKAEQAAKRKQ